MRLRLFEVGVTVALPGRGWMYSSSFLNDSFRELLLRHMYPDNSPSLDMGDCRTRILPNVPFGPHVQWAHYSVR